MKNGEIKPIEAAEPITILWFRPPKPRKGKKQTGLNGVIRRAEEAERALADANRRIAGLEAQLRK